MSTKPAGLAVVLCLTLAACSTASDPVSSSATTPATSAATSSVAAATPTSPAAGSSAAAASSESAEPSGDLTPFASAPSMTEDVDYPNQLEDFAAATFSDPLTIDNTWFPLVPGMQYTLEGTTGEADGTTTPHRFVLTVTDMTKVINGVTTAVVWDQDFEDDVLVEAELAFFAQADSGDIWHFGQYPEVYTDGAFDHHATWIAGVDGAQAGITIKATPVLGGPSYSQGWSPTVPWTDRARVGQVGVEDCVPVGCFTNVIVTEEFSREEPDALQLKYYAPGVGNTRVDFTGADQTREELELVDITELDPAGLDAARAAVVELEKSGYERSPDEFGTTAAAQQRS